MHTTEKNPLAKYVPAQLHKCKEWYISYYVLNPGTNKLQLIRNRVNRVKKVHDRLKWSNDLMRDINIKLASGWNPLIEAQSTKGYYKLNEVVDTFLKTKEKELRPDSIRSYRSYIKILKEYILKIEKGKDLYVINFNKGMAIDFLQDCYMKNKISERAYNNYITFYRTLFNWLIQLNYCNVNPFEKLQKKKEKQKTRILIDDEAREKLKNYLYENDYEFFIICMLAFYAFLRPKEISYLRFKDIDLENQKITVPGTVAKNGKDRIATIPYVLKKYMSKLDFEGSKKDEHVFSKGWKPGYTHVDSSEISRKWDNIRNAIKIPKEMQFSSLRDSGIVQMIHDDIPLDQIRDQADHSSLEITSVYVKHANTLASEEIKKKCQSF